MMLRLPDSGADVTPDGRRHAPSAARNATPILQALRDIAPATGRVLEIAAGTGQHAATFAAALPSLRWHPTDLNAALFPSICAWAAFTGANIAPPEILDATRPGWGAGWRGQDLVLIVNLLHLITPPQAATLLAESAQTLTATGQLVIYGPFLRDGRTISDGDAAFDASLRTQDPAIGYKDLAWITTRLATAGLHLRITPLPANNLLLIASRP